MIIPHQCRVLEDSACGCQGPPDDTACNLGQVIESRNARFLPKNLDGYLYKHVEKYRLDQLAANLFNF